MKKLKYIILTLISVCILSGCSSSSGQSMKSVTFQIASDKNQKITVKYNSSKYEVSKQDENQFLITEKDSDKVVVNGVFLEGVSLVQYKYYATTSGIPNIYDQKKEEIECGTAYHYTYKESDEMTQYVYAINFSDMDDGVAMYVYNTQEEFNDAIQNIEFSIEK